MKKLFSLCFVLSLLLFIPLFSMAEEEETYLVHLKTSKKRDPSQICVAYNMMWAAIKEGKKVRVLIDADAVNTYKIGWDGKDDMEDYKLQKDLRETLSSQFRVPLESVPKTYSEYLRMLKDLGVEFYINTCCLILYKIGTPEDPVKKVSAKFFKPVTYKEMLRLRAEAKYYIVY